MGVLLDTIRAAAREERDIVSWHAGERCEVPDVPDWQVVSGLAEAELLREHPRSRPNPSVVVRQTLPDGVEVDVVWSWLSESRRAKLVTVRD